MIHLSLNGHGGKALQVLCLGSHSDDIEIGCGGTILKLAQEHPQAVFHWVVFSAPGVRQEEALCAARMFAGERLREPLLKTFPDAFMPFVGDEVKAVFEELKKQISPDLIFTQNRRDAHQDHRLIAELTWNTFRDHLILEYEIPKYDGDLGQPNVFFPLSHDLCNRKLEYLMAAFGSQRNRRWFEEETFRALMRIRGMECNAESGYAEAFYCRKAVMLGA